jgi:hypothetical protein
MSHFPSSPNKRLPLNGGRVFENLKFVNQFVQANQKVAKDGIICQWRLQNQPLDCKVWQVLLEQTSKTSPVLRSTSVCVSVFPHFGQAFLLFIRLPFVFFRILYTGRR